MDESANFALAGAIALALAVLAWAGDRRRMRRRNADAVGFMPWTGVFFVALVATLVLLGVAARAWLSG